MYAFLLILGAVIAAAGVVLVAAGVPIQGHEFDATIITPGAVAVVGGLILVGLGLAVRVLGRIEQSLAARPMPRPARADDAGVAAVTNERPSAPARIPFPPKPTTESAAPSAPPAAAPAEEAAVERPRERFPTLVRLDSAEVEEEADVSLLPQPPVRADEEVREVPQAVATKQAATGATPLRTVTRAERSVRPAIRAERPKNFDAFWPKPQRPGQQAQPAAVQSAAPAPPVEPELPVEPPQHPDPAPELNLAASDADGPTPVSILKSGVVDGMAYTLYSDGSIEAQLPQGTLRFGSITELRNHIEQSA
ncbi:MAG TPA: hypothetical protein VMR17_09665 [Xanthobacteraceae bacterium]|nr:hypothetical protein [Xanthobacteraceae bacterium]